MTNLFSEVQEFIILPGTSGDTSAENRPDFKWTSNQTKILIDLYTIFKPKLGTLEVKTNKMLWERIAKELEAQNIHVTPNNCLNRWRVLERNYKRYIENQNKTGRGRQYFEFFNEMDAVLGKKKTINPEILLTTTTVDEEQTTATVAMESEVQDDPDDIADKENKEQKNKESAITKRKVDRKHILKQKKTMLQNIRLEKKVYQDKMLALKAKQVDELRRRNDLIAERNKILTCQQCRENANHILQD